MRYAIAWHICCVEFAAIGTVSALRSSPSSLTSCVSCLIRKMEVKLILTLAVCGYPELYDTSSDLLYVATSPEKTSHSPRTYLIKAQIKICNTLLFNSLLNIGLYNTINHI